MAGEGKRATTDNRRQLETRLLNVCYKKEQRVDKATVRDVTSKVRFSSWWLFCLQDRKSQNRERCPTESATKVYTDIVQSSSHHPCAATENLI